MYTYVHVCFMSCDWLYVQVSAGLFNTTYAIPRTSNIPSDSTEHKVSALMEGGKEGEGGVGGEVVVISCSSPLPFR